MAQINFPTATSNGQTFEADNGVIYTYVGTPPNGFWSGSFQATGLTTLDARFLKLDSSNDPVTGGLNITGGNVGIGTTLALSQLHILGDSDTTNTGATLLIDDSATAGADVGGTVAFRGSDGSIQRTYGLIKGGKTSSGANFDGYLSFQTRANGQSNTTEHVRITHSGFVGIGKSAPETTLHLRAGNPTITLEDGTGSLQTSISGNGGELAYSIAGSEAMRIDSSGNVGIGISNPSNLLEVQKAGDPSLTQKNSANDSLDRNNTHSFQFSDGQGAFVKATRPSGGSASDTYLAFGSGGSSEKVRIDSSGRVGIGTSSPSDYDTTSNNLVVGEAGAGDRGITIASGTSHRGTLMFADGTSGLGEYAGYLQYNHNGDYLAIATNNSEALRITSTGNVGVGTSSPSMLLDVRGASNPQIKVSATNTGTNSAGLYIENQGQRNWQIWADRSSDQLKIGHNSRANTVVSVTDTRVGIGTTSPIAGLTSLGINSGGQGGTMCIQNTGSGLNTNVALYLTPNNGGGNDLQRTAAIKSRQDVAGNFANLEFYTSTSNTPTERVRISSSGHFFTGGTNSISAIEAGTQSGKVFKTNHAASSGSTSTGQSFHFSFANPNGFVGSISTSGSGTAFNTSSDHRLKENVVDLDGAIDRVKQLAPKRFNFIADADTTLDGFLAHEAQAVVPEAVTGTHNEIDDDGNPVMQGIDQAKLVPLLTAALQETLAKVEALEQRLEDAGIT